MGPVFVDTSVVLAHVLGEAGSTPIALWSAELLFASRLLEYEAWVRLHAYGRAQLDGAALADAISRLNLLALDEASCERARAPFPVPVRTLDALHLAAADSLRRQGLLPSFATYDRRQAAAAEAMGFPLVDLA